MKLYLSRSFKHFYDNLTAFFEEEDERNLKSFLDGTCEEE